VDFVNAHLKGSLNGPLNKTFNIYLIKYCKCTFGYLFINCLMYPNLLMDLLEDLMMDHNMSPYWCFFNFDVDGGRISHQALTAHAFT